MQQTDNAYYRDDNHPIPRVDVCDIEAEGKNGGVDLVIVIASPLLNDERSRLRLTKKLENYLGYISSKEFSQRYGPPSLESTRIIVRHHPACAEAILDLLQQCRGWLEDNNAQLVIQSIP